MYNYDNEKSGVLTRDGVAKLLTIKDNMWKYPRDYIISYLELTRNTYGDSWNTLACVDWLEENGHIQCVSKEGYRQHWKYIKCG